MPQHWWVVVGIFRLRCTAPASSCPLPIASPSPSSSQVQTVLIATVTVDAVEGSSAVDIIDCYMKGDYNAAPGDDQRYIVQSQNKVTWKATEDPDVKVMGSKSFVKVAFVKPRWFLVPTALANRTGAIILRAVLNRTVKDFLTTLEQDYQAWARDDPMRQQWVA